MRPVFRSATKSVPSGLKAIMRGPFRPEAKTLDVNPGGRRSSVTPTVPPTNLLPWIRLKITSRCVKATAPTMTMIVSAAVSTARPGLMWPRRRVSVCPESVSAIAHHLTPLLDGHPPLHIVAKAAPHVKIPAALRTCDMAAPNHAEFRVRLEWTARPPARQARLQSPARQPPDTPP